MDQEPGQADAELSADARSPQEIRAEIHATREQLGDTVAAVAEKTDVKAQARGKLAAVKQTVQAKKDELTTKATNASPQSASSGVEQLRARARENPIAAAAAGAFLAGVLVGRVRRRS